MNEQMQFLLEYLREELQRTERFILTKINESTDDDDPNFRNDHLHLSRLRLRQQEILIQLTQPKLTHVADRGFDFGKPHFDDNLEEHA